MPQMAPYNWLIMFMTFNMIMLLIITLNYYLIITPPYMSSYSSKNLHKSYMWMW